MDHDELKSECERIYETVREAFATYDLDRARPYLDVPEDEPLPDRGQAQQLAAFLPDLARSRFLRLDREGDRAGYYLREPDEGGSATVTVIRFRKGGEGWRLAAGPHTFSSYSADRTDDAGVLGWIDREETLRLVPEGEAPPAPDPAPLPADADARPEAEVRAELERVWAGLRDALARGAPEEALPFIEVDDPSNVPPPDEAKRIARDLPDLAKSRFLRLGWRPGDPTVVGYYASTSPDDPETSTIERILFRRRDGRWRYAPGPGSLEMKTLPKTDHESLVRRVETDPALAV